MTEIQKYEPSNNLDDLQRTAKMLAASGYFGATGDANQQIAQVATKIMAGAELGYGPFASVNGIHIVNGKPSVSANLMASAVKSHPRYNYKVRKLDNSGCTIEFFEDGESAGTSEFTEQDAQDAGLLTGKNQHTWKNYRRNMLFARAMSNGVRWFCPDTFDGNAVYVAEELDEQVDSDGNVIDGGWREVQQQPTPEPSPAPATSDADDVQFMADDGGDDGADDEPAQDDDNPFENSNQELDLMLPDVSEWAGPEDAYAWAIEIGACENDHEARNSFRKIIETQSDTGRLNRSNARDMYELYVARQLEKLDEKQPEPEAV